MGNPMLAYDAMDAIITIGAEDTDTGTINVAIQLKGSTGTNLQHRASVLAYLSDDANGDSISATETSGAVAIGTKGLLIPIVIDAAYSGGLTIKNKTMFQLVSEADGAIDIDMTESGALTRYLVLVMPNGKLIVSDAITWAA